MLVARDYQSGSGGRQAGFVRVVAAALAVLVLVAGCSSLRKTIDRINHEASSSGGLESFIQQELTRSSTGRSARCRARRTPIRCCRATPLT